MLSKRICSNLVRNNYYKSISTNTLYLHSITYINSSCNNSSNNNNNSSNSNNINVVNSKSFTTKRISKNLSKLKKKKRATDRIPDSDTRRILAKYTMENPDDPNDNPIYYDGGEQVDYNFDKETRSRKATTRGSNQDNDDDNDNDDDVDISIDEEDFIDDEEFDKEIKEKLNEFDGIESQDPDFIRDNQILNKKIKQLKKVEDQIKSLSNTSDNSTQQKESKEESYTEDDPSTFTEDEEIDGYNDDDPQCRAKLEEDIKLEFWARQMALRDSLKSDGGAYLLNEDNYSEPIKNYKIMGKKLMRNRLLELKKEREERNRLKEQIKKMKMEEMGIDQELESQFNQIEKESKIKTNETLKDLLSEEEYKQLQERNGGDGEDDVQNLGEEGDDDDQELDEMYGDSGLPNLSRLRPYTPVPAPLEIVKEFLEIRKNELLKKSEEASDEFERKRRIKRIEFIAKKKELQQRQMIENFKKKGMLESIVTDEEDAPIEIDPKVFHRYQSGEITEAEMYEISKNQQNQEEAEIEFDHEGRRIRDNKFLNHWKVGSIGIPPLLKKRITQVIKQVPTAELRGKAEELSENLRARTRLGKPIGSPSIVPSTDDKPVIVYGKGEALAYISHRMPGVYACTHRVFSEIKTRIPNFNPTTLLDFGSGPGTVLWSASTIWGEHLKRIRAVEPSTFMVEVAKKLMEGNTNHIKWSHYLNTQQLERRDGTIAESEMNELVTASYVLSELPDQLSRFNLVKELWRHVRPSGMLVIIEPGTPVGFGIIKEIRQMLLDEGEEQVTLHKSTKAQVVAPCPHSGKCPMGFNSWCHFSQRVQRPVFQKLAKGPASTMPYEDEKYSYIVLSKVIKSNIPNQLEKQLDTYGEEELKEVKPWSRIVEAPLKRGGHVILDICSPKLEINRVTVAKSHGKEIYKEARKAFWSDGFVLPEDLVEYKEHRFNSTPEQEIEFQRLQEEEQLKQLKKLKKTKKSSSIRDLEKEEERERIEANRSEQQSLKAKKKEEEWMGELDGGDRKILEKLIKQGKFSTEESSSLFGDPALDKPIREKPKAGDLEFIEDIQEKEQEEEQEAIEEEEKKERKQNMMIETRNTRKSRKVQLLKDIQQFKKQSMAPEKRAEYEKKKEEYKKQKNQSKENDPTRIEHYLKEIDLDEESKVSQEEADRRFKERLEQQTKQQEEFSNAKGFGINSKVMREREKMMEKKVKLDRIAEFKKYKEERLKKSQNQKNQSQQNIDTFNNVD